MGAVPKRKVSRRRRNNRRAHHKPVLKHLVVCPSCNEYKVAHQVCPNCGKYNGRQVVEIKEEE